MRHPTRGSCMKTRGALLVVLSLALVTLSGCFGGDDIKADEAARLAAEALATRTTGSITGQVATSSLDPIEGAQVLLRNREESWFDQTDIAGRFTFNDLAPAHYTVEIAADGHQPGRGSALVGAGNVTTLAFMLEPVLRLNPFADTREYVGAYECGIGLEWVIGRRADSCTFPYRTAYDAGGGATSDSGLPQDLGNNQNTLFWAVGPRVQAVFSEITWSPGPTSPEHLRMTFGGGPLNPQTDQMRYPIMDVAVSSPGRAVVGFGLQDNYPADVVVHNTLSDEEAFQTALDWANGTLNVTSRTYPGYDYQLAYGLKFFMYVTAFYDMLPPVEFTAIPDQ